MDQYAVDVLKTILPQSNKIDLDGLTDIIRLLEPYINSKTFFYSKPSLSNPMNDVDEERLIYPGEKQSFFTANVNFFGLANVTSPLPEHYIESALSDDSGNISNLFSFYSSYFFKIFLNFIEKENYSLIKSLNVKNKIYDYVSAISNFPCAALKVNRRSFFLVSLIASNPSRSSICFFIKSIFLFKFVSIEDFILSYVDLACEFRACLGVRNATLQQDSYIGTKKKSYQSMIYINIQCQNSNDFYPGSILTRFLFQIVKHVLKSPISFEIYMTDSINGCNQSKLGTKATALGWNSVLFSSEDKGGKTIKKKLILEPK